MPLPTTIEVLVTYLIETVAAENVLKLRRIDTTLLKLLTKELNCKLKFKCLNLDVDLIIRSNIKFLRLFVFFCHRLPEIDEILQTRTSTKIKI